MEFTRHADVRAERVEQIAHSLRDLYAPTLGALPAVIKEKLERLAQQAKAPTD
jgi:hypothetical protein